MLVQQNSVVQKCAGRQADRKMSLGAVCVTTVCSGTMLKHEGLDWKCYAYKAGDAGTHVDLLETGGRSKFGRVIT